MASTTANVSIGAGNEVVQYIRYDTQHATAPVITVPAGKLWIITSVQVTQPDSTARSVYATLTDAADVVTGYFIPSGVFLTATTYAQNSVFSWTGKQYAPAGYKIKGQVPSCAVGTIDLYVTGLELTLGFNPAQLVVAG